jgi:hypothetical protein
MKSMQLTITHEEEFCDLDRFAVKVSGWSGFGISRMGVAVGSPELFGGLYGPRGLASQMVAISSQDCQRPQYIVIIIV